MRYRTFKGKSRQEAFAQLNLEKKSDPDLKEARLIKHSEEEVSSFMGLKKETIYEIVVGIPEHTLSIPNSTQIHSESQKKPQNHTAFTPIEQSVLKKRNQPVSYPETLFDIDSVARVADQISKLQTQSNTQKVLANHRIPSKEKQTNKEFENLKEELSGIKSEFQNIQNLLFSHLNNTQKTLSENNLVALIKESRELPNEHQICQQHIRWIECYLKEREFSCYFIEDFIAYVEKNLSILTDKKKLIMAVKAFLKENIPQSEINLDNYKFGNNIILVGPTGIGKTTAIVKIAAHLALMRKKQFRFISIDRHKVGGETQLEKLASYMNAKFYEVNKQETFFELLNNHECDYTFIDTGGKSPKESIAIQELSHWVNMIGYPIDIHLVISATTKSSDLDYICESFSVINYNHIIITKLDESKTFGSILCMAYKYKKSLSFITDGQEIPQDFSIADLDHIINESLL